MPQLHNVFNIRKIQNQQVVESKFDPGSGTKKNHWNQNISNTWYCKKNSKIYLKNIY